MDSGSLRDRVWSCVNRAILELETKLAEASLTKVEMRDPANYYNPKTVAASDEATPNFSWSPVVT